MFELWTFLGVHWGLELFALCQEIEIQSLKFSFTKFAQFEVQNFCFRVEPFDSTLNYLTQKTFYRKCVTFLSSLQIYIPTKNKIRVSNTLRSYKYVFYGLKSAWIDINSHKGWRIAISGTSYRSSHFLHWKNIS